MFKKIQSTVYSLQSTIAGFSIVGRQWTVDTKKGFTLVEILVAISILAVIGTVSIPNLKLFNDNQILQNTTNDLVRTLRDAQSAANSHVQCTFPLRAKNWVVNITNLGYQLEVSCYNPTSSAPLPAPEGRYSPAPALVNGVTFNIRTNPTGSCSPAIIVFGAEYQAYQQDRFSNISFNCSGINLTDNMAEIMLTKNSVHQYICIDKGGSINAAANVCF